MKKVILWSVVILTLLTFFGFYPQVMLGIVVCLVAQDMYGISMRKNNKTTY